MTISSNRIETPPGGEYDNTFLRQWAMPADEEGAGVALPRHADRSVQITGPFDGATLKIEGTIDGTTWGILTDPQGNDLTFTSYPAGYSTKIEAISEATVAVRPKTTGGGGSTALVITLLSRS